MNELEKQELLEIERIEDAKFNLSESEFKERFAITDAKKANWVLKKIKALQKEAKQAKEICDEEMTTIEAWYNEKMDKIDDNLAMFHGLLDIYAEKEREKDPTFKLSTPNGSISYRKQPDKWIYGENSVRDLQELGLNKYIRLKEELDKEAIKKHAHVTDEGVVVDEESGLVLSTVTVVKQEPKLVIKTEG